MSLGEHDIKQLKGYFFLSWQDFFPVSTSANVVAKGKAQNTLTAHTAGRDGAAAGLPAHSPRTGFPTECWDRGPGPSRQP